MTSDEAHYEALVVQALTLGLLSSEQRVVFFSNSTCFHSINNDVFELTFNRDTHQGLVVWDDLISVAAALTLDNDTWVQQNPRHVICQQEDQGIWDVWWQSGKVNRTWSETTGCWCAYRVMLRLATQLTFPLSDAIVLARAYAVMIEHHPKKIGEWPFDHQWFPKPDVTISLPKQAFLPLASSHHLYPVVDHPNWIERLLATDQLSLMQLRMKDADSAQLPIAIEQTVTLGHQHQAQVFINDHWQLALEFYAYGVHLGQEDLLTANLVEIQQAGLRLGISTHGYYELLYAMTFSPSYLALGHIFPTTTKDMPSLPQGVAKLRLYQALVNGRFPTVAIGGIDLNKASEIYRSGVDTIAVVRAITESSDLATTLTKFEETWQQAQSDKTNKVGACN